MARSARRASPCCSRRSAADCRAALWGPAGFGRISAALLALALVLGLGIAWASWRGQRPAGALVGAHAAVAIAGLVVLWALLALG